MRRRWAVANMADLHQAARHGDVAEIRRLVAAGVDVNEVDEAYGGETPLHIAAYNGHVEAVQTLVQLSAGIEAKNVNGATPLHYAAIDGEVEAVKTLVQLSANIEAKTASGATPLHLAVAYGRVQAVKTLLQLGAQIDARTRSGDTPLDLSVRLGVNEAAQVLRHFERPARTRKAATTRTHSKVRVPLGV